MPEGLTDFTLPTKTNCESSIKVFLSRSRTNRAWACIAEKKISRNTVPKHLAVFMRVAISNDPRLSDPACGTRGLQPEREGGVRSSASGRNGATKSMCFEI